MNADSTARKPGFIQGIMLLLPITMAVMGISVLTPIVHLLLQHFSAVPNHEYLVMGGVITMPAIWVLLFSPVAGWLADRFGRRNLLLLAMVVYALVGVAPAFLDNLYAIIATRIAVGICESIVMTVSTTMISDFFSGRTRERWLASQTAVASMSALGIIYLGGQLGEAYGWRGPFYLYFYSLLLAVGIAASVWEPRDDIPATEHSTAQSPIPVFPWSRTLGICALTLLASISFYTVITKNAEALVALGVANAADIGRYTMLASIGVPVGTFIYWGVARLPIHLLLLLDFTLIGAGFMLMGAANQPVAYAWGSFVNQIGCGIVLPTMLVWATASLPYAIRGRGNGLWQAAFAIGQFLSGMVVTLLSKRLAGLLPTLNIMGESALLFAVLAGLSGALWRRGGMARAVN
jgi:MFS family permease